MYDQLFSRIRLRYDELLAHAQTRRLLARSRAELLSRAAQVDALAEYQSAMPVSYAQDGGFEDGGLVDLPAGTLLALQGDDPHAEVLGEVIFFNKSVF